MPLRAALRVLRQRAGRLAREDGGMFSILHLYVMLLFMIFSALLLNLSSAMAEKVSAQNAADSTAISAATVLARGMNATTAVHHLTGELHALVVLHHAFGGYDLDDEEDPYFPADEKNRRQEAKDLQEAVDLAYEAAAASGAEPPPFEGSDLPDLARDRYPVGATLRDARNQLRKILAVTYAIHAAAGIAEHSVLPPVVAAGFVAAGIAFGVEAKIYEELWFLQRVEDVARATRVPKKAIENAVIPALQVYLKLLRARAPTAAEDAAKAIAESNAAEGTLYPPAGNLFGIVSGAQAPALPLQQESGKLTTDWGLLAKSQVVRATWPWVQDWRKPVRTALLIGATLSGASGFYKEWTATYALRKSRQFKERLRTLDLDLHVLRDCDVAQREKGNEPWAKASGSQRADELFCMLGFARQYPFRIAPSLYDQPNPDGIVAFGQAMVYNANPQSGGSQPVLGWDTLNWKGAVPDHPDDGGTPDVKLNWQAKLVPATRIDEDGVRQLPGAFGALFQRVNKGLEMGNTH